MKPCPSCGADAGAPRVGTLGESKGVWCKACGFATTTVDGWEKRPTAVRPRVLDFAGFETAADAALDRLAEQVFGMSRDGIELDEQFRQRIRAAIRILQKRINERIEEETR